MLPRKFAEWVANGTALLDRAFREGSRDFQTTGTVIAQAAVGVDKGSTSHADSRTTDVLYRERHIRLDPRPTILYAHRRVERNRWAC